MSRVLSAEDFACDFIQLPIIYLFDGQNSEQLVSCISQGHITVKTDRLLWIDRQSDWYRKQNTIGDPHFIKHTLVISFAHETLQWRESADCEQLQIANRACRQLQGRQLACVSSQLFKLLFWDHQVNQRALVRRN